MYPCRMLHFTRKNDIPVYIRSQQVGLSWKRGIVVGVRENIAEIFTPRRPSSFLLCCLHSAAVMYPGASDNVKPRLSGPRGRMRSCQGNVLTPYTNVRGKVPPTLRVPFTPPPTLNSSSVYLFQTSLPHLFISPSRLFLPPSSFFQLDYTLILPSPITYSPFMALSFTVLSSFFYIRSPPFPPPHLHISASPFTSPSPSPSVQTSSPHDYSAEVEVVPCRRNKNTIDAVVGVAFPSPT